MFKMTSEQKAEARERLADRVTESGSDAAYVSELIDIYAAYGSFAEKAGKSAAEALESFR